MNEIPDSIKGMYVVSREEFVHDHGVLQGLRRAWKITLCDLPRTGNVLMAKRKTTFVTFDSKFAESLVPGWIVPT